MSTKGKFIGSTTLTHSYSITLVKKVRKYLNVEIGYIIGFYMTATNDVIMTQSEIADLTQKLDLLGSSTLTTSNTVTMPKKVRESLNVKKGDNIAYYEGLIKQVILAV